MRRIAAVGTVVAGLVAAPVSFDAAAQDPSARVKELESAIERKRAETERLKQAEARLARETRALRAEMIAAARAIQTFEQEILDLEAGLAGLAVTESEIQRRLAAGRHQTVQAVMALQRLARFPPEAMIAMPTSPADTVRGAILLRAAVPAIERQAGRLGKDLAELDGTRRDMAEQRTRLARAVAGLKADRKHLDGLVERKAALYAKTRDDSREAETRVKAMAAEARSLHDLMRRIEADRQRREREAKEAREREEREARERAEKQAAIERKRHDRQAAAPPPLKPTAKIAAGRPITSARGLLPYPVVGRILTRYGDSLPSGLTAKGITIESGVDAQVIAPHDGIVVFAGPFRGYGQLLIIEHGEGYHTLLAGMARIDAEPGAVVQAGEPVGRMRHVAGENPALYVELRRNGHPINPLPWLAATKEKVSG